MMTTRCKYCNREITGSDIGWRSEKGYISPDGHNWYYQCDGNPIQKPDNPHEPVEKEDSFTKLYLTLKQ